jgi:hypothetical protein
MPVATDSVATKDRKERKKDSGHRLTPNYTDLPQRREAAKIPTGLELT